ncbi:hypothetical protein AGMMS49975_23050 [Clostridia bacterium]|nr:hypothetical protein AGMMS49975_23050 [Clostridia bacterium]
MKIDKIFKKYTDMCNPIVNEDAKKLIEQLREYIGASNDTTARLILEHFTQKGFCRICFATSTLEQGINMPFNTGAAIVKSGSMSSFRTLISKNLYSINNQKPVWITEITKFQSSWLNMQLLFFVCQHSYGFFECGF